MQHEIECNIQQTMIQCIQEPRPKSETLHIHYHYHDQISSLNNSQLPAAGSPQPQHCVLSSLQKLSEPGWILRQPCTQYKDVPSTAAALPALPVGSKSEVGSWKVGKLDPRSVWTGQVCHGIAAACQTSPTNLITPDGEGWIAPSISRRPSGISTSTSSDSGSTWKLQAGGSSWELLYQMSHACHAWCQET